MNLNKELLDYEIGGIGDIKKCTLRFHSYYVIARDGEVTIYVEYEPGNPPKVFNGYPSGQELLLELCNLHLEVKDMRNCSGPRRRSVNVISNASWCDKAGLQESRFAPIKRLRSAEAHLPA